MGVGYLSGSFDLLNVGDLDVIAQAGARCAELQVGVHPDEAVEALTGRPPVVPLAERLALVQHVRGVHAAEVHDPRHGFPVGVSTVFVVAGAPTPAPEGAVLLTPERETASAALRAALRAPVGEAVA